MAASTLNDNNNNNNKKENNNNMENNNNNDEENQQSSREEGGDGRRRSELEEEEDEYVMMLKDDEDDDESSHSSNSSSCNHGHHGHGYSSGITTTSGGSSTTTNNNNIEGYASSNTSTMGFTVQSSTNRSIPESILAVNETKNVNLSRLVVFAVLVCSALSTGIMVFLLISASEQHEFETQFDDFAYEIADVSKQKSNTIYSAAATFSATVTSHALSSFSSSSSIPFVLSSSSSSSLSSPAVGGGGYTNNRDIVNSTGTTTTTTTITPVASSWWPNVTIPYFEKHGKLLQDATGIETIAFSPIVTILDEWNEYSYYYSSSGTTARIVSTNSYHHQHQENITNEENDDDDSDDESEKPTLHHQNVYRILPNGTKITEDGTMNEYCPLWQIMNVPKQTSSQGDDDTTMTTTKSPTGIINFNLLSHSSFARVFDLMRDSQDPVLSEVINVSDLFGGSITTGGAAGDSNGQQRQRQRRQEAAGTMTDESSNYNNNNNDDVDYSVVHPKSFLAEPVFDDFDENMKRQVVGTIITVIPWDVYFHNLLHEGANGILCVLRNTCGDVFTYEINGPRASFVGQGDYHDFEKYNHMEHTVPFGPIVDFTDTDDDAQAEHCAYTLHLYPTKALEDSFHTSRPVIFAIIIIMVFVFTSLVFLVYDFLVNKRQLKVQNHAIKSNAIVSSLFPAEIRERLFQQNDRPVKGVLGGGRRRGRDYDEDDSRTASITKKGSQELSSNNGIFMPIKHRLKNYLSDDDENEIENKERDEKSSNRRRSGGGSDTRILEMYQSKPIADLFPNTTVMFADIAGFTAWSSVREPPQVFTLLETVYRAFDVIAKRRRVFKVETVGDCYVAVTGLPEPHEDHAVLMARYARDCMDRMNKLAPQLEIILGPDTGDLAMRFGLHSGPVTAGVLRGERSRFQLFGDTVNTAARIESTGLKDRIHVSQETAELLKKAGKGDWITPRRELVHAKGKGNIQTYWLLTKDGKSVDYSSKQVSAKLSRSKKSSVKRNIFAAGSSSKVVPSSTKISPKIERLIDWNVDVLTRLLRLIVAKRLAERGRGSIKRDTNKSSDKLAVKEAERNILEKNEMVLNEVTEIITLPKFNANVPIDQLNPDDDVVDIPKSALNQLREYVQCIASSYRENPFHNFEHASHVTMSVSKLLSRIVAPDIDIVDRDNLASNLHDHTYGITSDPLTQFAVVISAMIHDADHVGIPNFLLMNENKDLSKLYQQKSIAEQNSVDLAWELLMEPRFAEFRSYVYTNVNELERFRQLLVNTVLATDIFDKELSALRKARWAKAFSSSTKSCSGDNSDDKNEDRIIQKEEEEEEVDKNRKATIVIEHLIQASDVAHTMQHWHIYQKWNERLFEEMYTAYKLGRSKTDPSEGWYEGEIKFFDGYVIPLAKKLKECGVFGVSSDEYLNYALDNRREWESKGAELVLKFVERYGESDKSDSQSEQTESTMNLSE